METDFLLTTLKSTLSKKRVEELAIITVDSKFSIKELIDLTLHAEEQVGFRASWILETVYINNSLCFIPHITYFLTKFHQRNNLSSRRHFGKILALMTAKKAPFYIAETISKHEMDKIVETVFGW